MKLCLPSGSKVLDADSTVFRGDGEGQRAFDMSGLVGTEYLSSNFLKTGQFLTPTTVMQQGLLRASVLMQLVYKCHVKRFHLHACCWPGWPTEWFWCFHEGNAKDTITILLRHRDAYKYNRVAVQRILFVVQGQVQKRTQL